MMMEFFSQYSAGATQLVVWGFGFLLQSTVLAMLGLLAARLCRRFGAAVQSSILKVTLVAILVSPLAGNLCDLGLVDIAIPGDAETVFDEEGFLYAPDERPHLDAYSRPSYSVLEWDRTLLDEVLYSQVAMSGNDVFQQEELSLGPLVKPAELSIVAGKNPEALIQTARVTESGAQTFLAEKGVQAVWHWSHLYLLLCGVWIAGSIFLLVRLARGLRWVSQLRREGTVVENNLNATCLSLAREIGISPPPILVHPEIQSPMLVGWIHSAIVIPNLSPEMTSPQVLIHELAHLKRGDCLWNLISRVATALCFFQPLLWTLTRKMEEASEEVCDDFVLHYASERQSYARRLVNMAEKFGYCPNKPVGAIGVLNLRSSLGQRVERILDDSRKLSLRTGSRALFIVSVFALIAVLGVSLLGITPAVSAAEAGGKTYKLKSDLWSVSIQPSTMKVIAQPKQGEKFALSQPIDGIGLVKKVKKKKNRISWEVPDKGASVSMNLNGDHLDVNIQVKDPVVFSWPRLRMDEPVKGLIWPHWEGSYIPIDDQRWMDRLLDWESIDTLEGLGMPFWAVDCGDYSLTYIVTNRYNNEIRFSKEEDRLVAQFNHDFPPNHAPRNYGFQIFLGENKSPVEPAQKFREWLIEKGEFVSMQEKMKNTPKVERLLGAAHAYLWGDAFLAKNNVQSSKSRWAKVWKPFTRQMIAESKSDQPTVGKHLKNLMGDKQWTDLIVEMAKVPWDYQYLQTEICQELSNLLARPDFYDETSWQGIEIPDEAKALLAQERSSLSLKDLARMNGLLLRAAYPDHLLPVDQWGGAISVAMLKQIQEAGFDRMRVCLDGKAGVEMRPEVAVEADKMGYLFGIYDSFHSIHDPKYKGTDASWDTAQFCQELYDIGGIMRRDGTIKKGFKKVGYNLSPIAARPYVEQRVNQNFERVPYNYYFIDCDAFGQVFDDYTPGREVTQQEDAMERNDRMKWITDKFDVVMGSEGGSSYSAPAIHIAEGMFLTCFGWGDADLRDKESEYFEGKYYPPDGPGIFFKPTKLKEKYRYFHFDPRFRLPLFETVFHDSVIATNHWGRGNLKYPEEKDLVFLTQLLYQLPPMYHLNVETFKKRKDVMKKQYDFFSPLHRELGFSQMTDFAWMTEDRLVQKTVFDDKVEIVANFSEKEFVYQNKSVPAGSVMALWKDSGEVKVYTPTKSEGE